MGVQAHELEWEGARVGIHIYPYVNPSIIRLEFRVLHLQRDYVFRFKLFESMADMDAQITAFNLGRHYYKISWSNISEVLLSEHNVNMDGFKNKTE